MWTWKCCFSIPFYCSGDEKYVMDSQKKSIWTRWNVCIILLLLGVPFLLIFFIFYLCIANLTDFSVPYAERASSGRWRRVYYPKAKLAVMWFIPYLNVLWTEISTPNLLVRGESKNINSAWTGCCELIYGFGSVQEPCFSENLFLLRTISIKY